MPIMTALWRQGRRISEFLASLVYRARAVTQRSPVLIKRGGRTSHTHTLTSKNLLEKQRVSRGRTQGGWPSTGAA